jgi:tetratricopeptide (TPR) repeat protein
MKKLFLIPVLSFMLLSAVSAQDLTLPQVSPKAEVSQVIGISKISIEYHRPAVRGRKIWGSLVPYDGSVWRAGANENTVFSVGSDCKINGKFLPAGSYGFHIIPSENEWTLIFSKNYTSWGSFFYDKAEDALRIKVKPSAAPFAEWLTYGFENLTPSSADAFMHWEKLKVNFKVEFDVDKIVLEHINNELRSSAGFTWQGYYDAASYCLENNINYEKALQWIDRSIQMMENYYNLSVKLHLLEQAGKENEVPAVEDRIFKVLETATESQINTFGYLLLNQNKKEKALKAFTLNVKRFPESWNVYDSLADAYARTGNKREAIKQYQEALGRAPEDQKDRIRKILDELRAKS